MGVKLETDFECQDFTQNQFKYTIHTSSSTYICSRGSEKLKWQWVSYVARRKVDKRSASMVPEGM